MAPFEGDPRFIDWVALTQLEWREDPERAAALMFPAETETGEIDYRILPRPSDPVPILGPIGCTEAIFSGPCSLTQTTRPKSHSSRGHERITARARKS